MFLKVIVILNLKTLFSCKLCYYIDRENSKRNHTDYEELLSAFSSMDAEFGARAGDIVAAINGNLLVVHQVQVLHFRIAFLPHILSSIGRFITS